MKEYKTYRIAGFVFSVSHDASCESLASLLPSFKPFETQEKDAEPAFSLSVDNRLKPDVDRCELIGEFDTGNGKTAVYQRADGGYQYIIKNINGDECCLLKTNQRFTQSQCALRGSTEMQAFGLSNSLMFICAFGGSFKGALLVHASCVRHNGLAYPFIAKSGTGKSTHSNLWLKNIPGTDLINDDNPIIRLINGSPVLFGSPWSGKTPCYRPIDAPLGAITRIARAPVNSIERLAPVQAFASLLPACSTMKWDSTIYDNICNSITAIIETTPIYTLHCLPDDAAAILCHSTIAR